MDKRKISRRRIIYAVVGIILLALIVGRAIIARSNDLTRIKSTETQKTTNVSSDKKEAATQAPTTSEQKPAEEQPAPAPIDPNGCEAKGMWWRADNYECIPKTDGSATVASAPVQSAQPVAVQQSAPVYSNGGTVWDSLAQCEASGNWAANTGNGFSGGLQFTPSTWAAFGGTGQAWQASREQQIAVAERVLAGQGWGAWPACTSKLGLR